MSWPPGPPGSGLASYNRPSTELGRPGVQSSPPPAGKRRADTGRESGADHSAPVPPAADSIAVLTPAGLKTRTRWAACNTSQASTVLETALRLGIRQIWVGPATAAHLGLPATFEAPPGTDPYRAGIPHPWLAPALASWPASTEPAGLAPWVSLGTPGRWVDLVIPSWDPSTPWQASTAGELLEALELYATHVGLRYRRSPATTGLALMREVHKGPQAIALPTDVKLPPPALAGGSQTAGSWIAPRLPASGYLHAWDLNGMYLAACSSAELGFGEPRHLDAGAIPGSVGELGAGYYRARVSIDRRDRRPAAPFKVDAPGWYTAPALDLLFELGAQIQTLEAWVYPDGRRWLAPWYERLRDARRALLALEGPAARLALAATKQTYAAALGRLKGSWMQAGDPTFRPDWRQTVLDRARANMHRHTLKVYTHSRTLPLAADLDLIVYPSKLADPAQAAAQLGLEVDLEQLGKWKPAGSVAAKRVREAIGSKRGLAAQRALLEVLK